MTDYIKNILSLFVLIYGLLIYFFFKKNTYIAHQALIRTYVLTRGLSNIILSKLISLYNLRKIKLVEINSYVFKKKEEFISDALKNDGYYVFKQKIQQSEINTLIDFAQNSNGFFFKESGKLVELNYKKFDFSAATFNYDENALVCNPLIRKLATNKLFLNIASKYFQSVPILSAINMWWSIPALNIDSAAGQLYHFDMDRIKFLKFFIYLTEVDINNGPHCYVKGTHKLFSKKKLLNKGYQRISDSEIKQNYSKEDIKILIGDAGTIIVGDTSCFHKGLPPKNKKRLILEFEYSNSLFGTPYKKISDISKKIVKADPILEPLVKNRSQILSRYY